MTRPDFEYNSSGDEDEELVGHSPQSSVDYLQFGAAGGHAVGMVQEGATGSLFAAEDESDDEA